MDCDLVEVSGQMVLPLPNLAAVDRSQTVPRPPSPGRASWTRHRPFAPSGTVVPNHKLPRISRQPADGLRRDRLGRRWLGPGTARGTVSRAQGESPDDRSLETLTDPLGAVPGRRSDRRGRHRGDARAAIV